MRQNKSIVTVLTAIAFFAVLESGANPLPTYAQDGHSASNVSSQSPQIMIAKGAELPSGGMEQQNQISGGTINGELLVEGNLVVDDSVTVDGQLVVGNQMGSPLSAAIITSRGNQNAEAPATPLVKWGDSVVHGPLIVRGPMVVTGSLFFIRDISVAGTMRSYCSARSIFFPAGSYPFAQRINFNCPKS